MKALFLFLLALSLNFELSAQIPQYIFDCKVAGQINTPIYFDQPTSLDVDAAGNIYVANLLNHRIQIFDNTGIFIATFGSFGNSNRQFNSPNHLTLDDVGNVYVTDVNNRIQAFDDNGLFLRSFGSAGTGNGQFDETNGIEFGTDRLLYISDK